MWDDRTSIHDEEALGDLSDQFFKARQKEIFSAILSVLKNEKEDLLSFDDIKAIIKPQSESYRGVKTIAVNRIVGSEGRYRDFNRSFLPRYKHLRHRWMRIGLAHVREIELPAIKVYELGGVYFVRDGNHRVSVAKMYGKEFIDAEITSLESNITLSPGMTEEDIKEKVIQFEKWQFNECTRLNELRPECRLDFTALGRYDEICRHIQGHMRHMSQGKGEKIGCEEAMISWCTEIYSPVTEIIREEKLLSRFPNRTPADLYVWVVRHWDELKSQCGEEVSVKDAATDYADRYPGSWVWKIIGAVRKLLFPPSDCP